MNRKLTTTKEVSAYLGVQMLQVVTGVYLTSPILRNAYAHYSQIIRTCRDSSYVRPGTDPWNYPADPSCRQVSVASNYIHNAYVIGYGSDLVRVAVFMLVFFLIRQLLNATPVTVTAPAGEAAMSPRAPLEPTPSVQPQPRNIVAGDHANDGTLFGIVALVLALLGFVPTLGLIASLLALFFGFKGRAQATVAANNTGQLLSTIGLVLAALTLCLGLFGLIVAGGLLAGLGMVMAH